MTKPKVKAAPLPVEQAPNNTQIVIDVNDYIRTRDSVVTGLATLQDAIQTLSSAYIKHTNAVLGDHATNADIDSSLSKLGDNPALLGDLQRAISPAGKSAAAALLAVGSDPNDKKERKKRQHDPNAPKRPLTPFFLYMQTARPIISDDLGPDFAKGAVSAEGTRRWGTMNADDKQLWTNAYKDNLRLYNARMHSYRRGNLSAKDMTDQDAATYAEENNVGENSADAQLAGEASATALHDEDAEGEPEREPTPPPPAALPKTPKAKASTRKGKGAKETPVPASDTIVPPSSIVPAKAAAPEVAAPSPDKKRKRPTKKSTEAADEQAETPKSQPKSSRKKKAKGE